MSASTGKITQGEKMSRTQLCRALAEMGIMTPAVMKIDMMRLLNEANVKEGSKTHDDRVAHSSTRAEGESDALVDMITDSSDDEAEEAQE
jgi:hypothetical protein